MPLSSSEADSTSHGGTPPQPLPHLSDTNNYYTYLNIAPSSTKQELSKIKRNLGLQHHPDRLVSVGGVEASPAATAEFQKMMELIDILLDDGKRLEHDTKCGINMNMRIDDILHRGQRLAYPHGSGDNTTNNRMYVHPDNIRGASNNSCAVAPPARDDESDDDEEYCPSPLTTTPSNNSTTSMGIKAAAAAEEDNTTMRWSGNLSLFGAKEFTQDDINVLGFKPKKVVATSAFTSTQNNGGDEPTAHGGGGGSAAAITRHNHPIVPPPGLIGVANDPALDNTKAFESVGLKRERSPHLIRQQGTMEVELLLLLGKLRPGMGGHGHVGQRNYSHEQTCIYVNIGTVSPRSSQHLPQR